MVTQIPLITNWSVFPQNGDLEYFDDMNVWIGQGNTVIPSANASIVKMNEAIVEINNITENAINAITFDNIAQLRLNSNIGRVDILGYYTKGDGGGGAFYWDSTSTETDNAGTIIQATGMTTGRWKRVFSGAVSVKWFGAKGDGITDDTDAIQKALGICASSSTYVSGEGIYRVSTINMVSGQRVKNLALESIGALSGGAISMQPVVEIDGTLILQSNMIFKNVKVNGRRELLTSIDMNGGGDGEDGGMHCWRVIGTAIGGVEDITWVDCEGINGGTAGLAIHNTNPTIATADYPFKHLKWTGGKLSGNRQHGWFADSFEGIQIHDVDCRNNGKDLNVTDALEHGNRGARSAGKLFGTGFDLESYIGFNGSLWSDAIITNLDCRSNAMPSGLYNPIATDVPGWRPHTNIRISGCQFDKGTAMGVDRPANSDYSFNALGNLVGTSYPYLDLIMSDNYFFQAPPQFNGVKGLALTGGYINCNTNKANIYNCLHYDVSAPSSALGLSIFPVVNPVLTKVSVSAGSIIEYQSTTRVLALAGGGIKYHIEGYITGAAAIDGDFIFTTVSPIPAMIISEMTLSARQGAGRATATATSVDINGTATALIETTLGSIIYYKLIITLSNSK